jgi:ABC-2 type transport system permease protein
MSTTLSDTLVIFRRSLRLSLRNPVWVIIGLLQPLLYLGLFGPLLEKLTKLPGFPAGSGGSWRVFVPGLLVQLGIFGAAFVGFGLIDELRAGVIERMRVTPASRVSLLAGRVLRDVVVLLVQGTVLVLAALAFGLSAPVGDLVLGLVLVAVLGAAFASASYALGLLLRAEDSMASVVNSIAVPLLLLSGILLPMSLAPAWLRDVSDVNPVKHVVDAVRAVFLGHFGGTTVVWGIVATVALAVAGMTFGTLTFRRQSA